jgi:hypothetical protein
MIKIIKEKFNSIEVDFSGIISKTKRQKIKEKTNTTENQYNFNGLKISKEKKNHNKNAIDGIISGDV